MRITMELCLKFEQKQVMMLAAQRLSDVLGAEMVIVYTLDRSSGELVGYTSGAKTQVWADLILCPASTCIYYIKLQ